jgi:ureidoacrylate peracid hydrolase
MIRRAVAPTARVVTAARASRIPVVFLKMAFRPDLSDAGPFDSPNHARHLLLGVGTAVCAPNGSESRVLIRDTWNTDILPELAPKPQDIVLYKHRFSGFFQTDLDAILTSRNIKYLIVTGCTTSICVDSTIRDAMFRDYSCVLLADCTAEPIGNDLPRSNHDASFWLCSCCSGGWPAQTDLLKPLFRTTPLRLKPHQTDAGDGVDIEQRLTSRSTRTPRRRHLGAVRSAPVSLVR